jgi:2,4-dienoyl-CoA reductase-like NADH-dependent reductase (Old Yellow Enzyme family)
MQADPFAPACLGPARLRNRVVKAATFEGMSPAGVVSASLIDFHRRIAAGGVGMTTVSYVAVSREGRGAPNEIYIRDAAADGLARIAAAVHAEGAAISAQLGYGVVRARPGLVPSIFTGTRRVLNHPVPLAITPWGGGGCG